MSSLVQVETVVTSFVEFFMPGSFVPEASVEEVGHRDPHRIDAPYSVFAFQFFDKLTTEVAHGPPPHTCAPGAPAESNAVALSSSRLNVSPRYYTGGYVMSIDDVRRDFPDERILISNMECNNYDRVILTRCGNFQSLNEGDLLKVGGEWVEPLRHLGGEQ